MSIPEELARREKRLPEIARVRAIIQAHADEHFDPDQTEHDAKNLTTVVKHGGKPPAPPVPGPLPIDPVNLMEEDPRIMPVACGDFEHRYVVRRHARA